VSYAEGAEKKKRYRWADKHWNKIKTKKSSEGVKRRQNALGSNEKLVVTAFCGGKKGKRTTKPREAYTKIRARCGENRV